LGLCLDLIDSMTVNANRLGDNPFRMSEKPAVVARDKATGTHIL
jgi:hypothetical protein